MKPNRAVITRIILVLLVVMLNVGCDQVSKTIARRQLPDNDVITMMGDHFTLVRVENTGAFLSMGATMAPQLRFILFTVLPVIGMLIGIVLLLRQKSLAMVQLISVCFIIGGGIGNIFDRAMYGSVTDFMHISFGKWQTGIFNMADVSVTLGILVLLFSSWFSKDKPEASQLISDSGESIDHSR